MADVADLLFELGTEELPPLALPRLSQALQDEFIAGLDDAGLQHGEVTAFATPRRLALLIRDCQTAQPDRQSERRGPAVAAAFDAAGNPSKAALGFAKSCGQSIDELQRLKTDKGEWLVSRQTVTGKPAVDLLPAIAAKALDRLPIPKRMRWGDSEALFVRPVHWLVFLLGDEVVPCTLLDAAAGRLSYGHRFHHPHAIEISRPVDYADQLRDVGYVIANFDERRQRIRELVQVAAEAIGGRAEIDENLLNEVTALNEWPVPISASFEQRFLEVPHEALILTMKKNQKYFPLFDANGGLLNHFITIANIDSPQPELIKEGNERVVRPRLADAMFFWQQDGKRKLADHAESLKGVIFQKQLGSLHDKSERVAELAASIAEYCAADVSLVRRAALLSRCDLMTEMVYEFPDMQGIMGRYQARRDGEPDELALAMDEFYMPRYSGDQLPQSPTGIAIALADRLDTLVGIFGIGQRPTGTKDPFALRRATLGLIRIIREHSLSLNVSVLISQAIELLGSRVSANDTHAAVLDFLLERLRGMYADEGVSANQFEAVRRVAPDILTDFDARIGAVRDFSELPEAEALAAANKRIGNILKKVDNLPEGPSDPALFVEDAESALSHKLSEVEGSVQPQLAAADYNGAMRTMARLREPIDGFFDQVMVMAEDADVRNNRLRLLRQVQQLFLRVADISCLQE